MSNDTNETSWQSLFGDKGMVLLLGVGLFLLLGNALIFGVGIRANTWMFYLDMRYWPVYMAIPLWITAIWVASETTDFMQDYVPFVRIIMVFGILLAFVYVLLGVFGIVSAGPVGYQFLSFIVVIVTICCIVRSLLLFYDYRFNGEEYIDMEEATWFWKMSGFFFAGLIIFGIMALIPVKVPMHGGIGDFTTASLLASCQHGLHELVRTGKGSLALKMFAISVLMAIAAFVYVAGKWALIVLSKLHEERD